MGGRDFPTNRPLLRPAPRAFGPLFIPEDDLLAITRAQARMGDRAPAQVTRQVDQDPLPRGIALADVHMPFLAAQRVQQILHLWLALPSRAFR